VNPKSFAKQVRAQYEQYDVLIIDCPPALSPIAVKAMYASHLLVIPVSTTGGSDVWVSEQLLEKFQEIREAKEDAGDDPVQAQLLVNMYRRNVTLHELAAGIVEQLAETYDVGVFDVRLGNRVAYGEANVSGMGVLEYGLQVAGCRLQVAGCRKKWPPRLICKFCNAFFTPNATI